MNRGSAAAPLAPGKGYEITNLAGNGDTLFLRLRNDVDHGNGQDQKADNPGVATVHFTKTLIMYFECMFTRES
jgi:hypothetical protein